MQEQKHQRYNIVFIAVLSIVALLLSTYSAVAEHEDTQSLRRLLEQQQYPAQGLFMIDPGDDTGYWDAKRWGENFSKRGQAYQSYQLKDSRGVTPFYNNNFPYHGAANYRGFEADISGKAPRQYDSMQNYIPYEATQKTEDATKIRASRGQGVQSYQRYQFMN